MMRPRLRRTGDASAGCLLWILVVLAIGFVLWKAVPIKLASVELYDFIDEQAQFAQRATAEGLRKEILGKAKELGLPLAERDLSIEKSEARIRIHCTYVVPLELPGYTYMWRFEQKVDKPLFYF